MIDNIDDSSSIEDNIDDIDINDMYMDDDYDNGIDGDYNGGIDGDFDGNAGCKVFTYHNC